MCFLHSFSVIEKNCRRNTRQHSWKLYVFFNYDLFDKYGVIDYAECIEYCINKIQDSHSKNGYISDGYFEFIIEVIKDALKKKKISQDEYNLKQKELYILKAKLNEKFADSLKLPIQKSHYYEIAIQSLKQAGINPYSKEFIKRH